MQGKQIQQILEDAIVQYLEKYKYQESISEHGEVQEIQVRYSKKPEILITTKKKSEECTMPQSTRPRFLNQEVGFFVSSERNP